MPRNSRRIDRVAIRMYRMGTGDCFTIKFMKGSKISFKMMIDCGCWQGGKSHMLPFVTELKNDLKSKVDALVVTHEHKDHVSGFDACKDQFSPGDFETKQIWMAWTEEDGNAAVEKWKTSYGEKRKALALAADRLKNAAEEPGFALQLGAHRDPLGLKKRCDNFIEVLDSFSGLHSDGLSATGDYVDGLAGMKFVKETMATNTYSYFRPGDVVENEPGLEGVRIYVLGPPIEYDQVKKEKGPAGEAYEHNDKLQDVDSMAMALNADDAESISQSQPFADFYQTNTPAGLATYDDSDNAWRRIDHDWLFSAGNLALRMNSRTNNLSLVLAIEFIESGKVLLFPGDAEFGSWKSWHSIDWTTKFPGLTTEKLLNRVVFYKVAHHLSHNGTARSIGLRMMTSPELTSMATLDYDNISSGWVQTMPNEGLLQDLLEQTSGRTLVMNPQNVYFKRSTNALLQDKIEEYRVQMGNDERADFEANVEETDKYISFTIDV